jgi:hypothetical protein
MASSIHERLWALGRVLLHAFVFGLFGPAIGTVASPGVVLLPFSAIFAYATSFAPAILTGCVVGVASLFIVRERTLYLIAAVAGVLFGAVAGYAGMFSTPPVAWVLIHIFSGFVAALVCTYMSWEVRKRPSEN